MLERLKRWIGTSSAAPAAASANVGAAQPATSPEALQPDSVGSRVLVVIDVRTELEFQAAAIDHAVNLPLSQLERGVRALVTDTATPLALYCASGARSGMACTMLRQLGYTNVTNAGGLQAAAARLRREIRR